MKDVNYCIQKNCELLQIPEPKVFYSKPAYFKTETTRAAIVGRLDDGSSYELHLNTKYFNKNTKEYDCWITVSHELRHLWQMKSTLGQDSFSAYEQSNLLSIKEYNEQELEVDAWAWAFIMAIQVFGNYPDLDFLGEGYTEKVLEKAQEIIQFFK